LSPRLVEATLQGRQPVELTTTRLTELDLPLDWTQQHKPLASSSQTRRSAHWRRERSELKPAKAPVFNKPTVQRR
jgi:hypothetical protein